MSVNRYAPHLYVLPEDDANRQIANGFLLNNSVVDSKIRVLEEAGGWQATVDRFCAIYAPEMDRFPQRFMVLLIDFDGHFESRSTEVRERIPEHLRERVFVLGSLREPEDLKQDMGSFELIGLQLANDCKASTDKHWSHGLLRHNSPEVQRLQEFVRPFLFA